MQREVTNTNKKVYNGIREHSGEWRVLQNDVQHFISVSCVKHAENLQGGYWKVIGCSDVRQQRSSKDDGNKLLVVLRIMNDVQCRGTSDKTGSTCVISSVMIETLHYIDATCGAQVFEPCRNFKLAVFKY
jgi:hypothetical protein